jgi:hypothetical protein
MVSKDASQMGDEHSKDPPPPIAAEIVDALDFGRLDYISDTLAKASLLAAGASLAAEVGDIATLAARSRQAVIALKEACLIMRELGEREVAS